MALCLLAESLLGRCRCSLMAKIRSNKRMTHSIDSRRQAKGPGRLQKKSASLACAGRFARGPFRFSRKLDFNALVGDGLDECIPLGAQAGGQGLRLALAGLQFNP